MSIDATGGDTVIVGNAAVTRLADDILSVNDNGGKGGFDLAFASVDGNRRPGAYALHSPDTVQDSNTPVATGRVTTTPPAWRVALLSRRYTDVLVAGIERWPAGVFADPTTVEGRAAWYSFAFWLRQAAAARLDVDTNELEAGFRSISQTGRPVGQAFLSDRLENGAGYCRLLADPDQFESLLAHARPAARGSIAAEWTEILPQLARPTPHGLECDTSCNRCLRDFGNLPYHGLLDWRLALDMARLATSYSARIDLGASWVDRENPWLRLVAGVQAPVPSALARLRYRPAIEVGGLRVYLHADRPRVLIERHPLWTNDHPAWRQAVEETRRQHPDYGEPLPVNPFRVVRRPGEFA